MLERARAAIGKRSQAKQNYHGAEVRDHWEWEARRIIAQRLLEAGLKSLDLALLPKGDPRKIQIAKEVRTKTGVPLHFAARVLSMGTRMNVSNLTNRCRVVGMNIISPDPSSPWANVVTLEAISAEI
ncbi:MAG: hypothetical protein H0X40_05525 [Chthoniobacterales bacterium]|nr:hypothetical protein [Chthoniobacterales bacterium]